MIIGKGLIANAFASYEHDLSVLIFASGVSDSATVDENAFQREQELVERTLTAHSDKLFVYFSTCSIYDPESNGKAYTRHKTRMEKLVETADNYLIARVSNAVGHGGNSVTLMNFLVNCLVSRLHFTVWNKATRNIISVEDVYRIVNSLISKGVGNTIVNVANPESYKVPEIVSVTESTLGVCGVYSNIERGTSFQIDVSDTAALVDNYADSFGTIHTYLPAILKKYFLHAAK